MTERSDNLLRDLLDATSWPNVQAAAPAFARPNDVNAYAIGDLVANDTVVGNVVALVFAGAARVARPAARRDPSVGPSLVNSGMVARARIRKNNVTIANAQFRLHLYSALPVPTNGDNGVWLSTQSAAYLGCIDVTLDKVFSDGAAGQGALAAGQGIGFQVPAAQTVLYGLLEARAAYVPVALEQFTVTLEIRQD